MLSVRPNPLHDSDGSSTLDDAEGGAKIEFKSVDFTYPTRDLKVFRNLSFTVEKGQFAALVGPSGCGKTTTIALLEKYVIRPSSFLSHLTSCPGSTTTKEVISTLTARNCARWSQSNTGSTFPSCPKSQLCTKARSKTMFYWEWTRM